MRDIGSLLLVLLSLVGQAGCKNANDVSFFIEVPTDAPGGALRNPKISTNNWVKETSLTDEQRRTRSKDLDQLIRKANEGQVRGERIEKVVLSGEDFAWVTYLKDEQHSPRIVGLRKQNDGWQ